MSQDKSSLIQHWELAEKNLGLDITYFFKLALSEDKVVESELLVKNFGADNGMLVVRKYSQVKNFLDDLAEAKYGFSVLDDPGENEDYDTSEYIDMLSDWEWSGNESDKPKWLIEPIPPAYPPEAEHGRPTEK